jgi:hypothetical protein
VASRRRWQIVSSTACSALVLLPAACGGDGSEGAAAPSLPRDVGTRLAEQADAVEQALAGDDLAQARAEADALVAAVEQAIASGRVPRALRDDIRAGARRLASLIPEPEPEPGPAPPPAPEPAPPAEPPPAEDCGALEEQKQALEEQIDALPKDDPVREELEAQKQALDEQLEACKGNGNGKGKKKEDEGDD